MSGKGFADRHPTNKNLVGDFDWGNNSAEELRVPMQTLALDLCTTIPGEERWSDRRSDVCSCRPILSGKESTHRKPKSSLWDSCERKYGSAESIPGIVRSSEICRSHTSLDCYALCESSSSKSHSQRACSHQEQRCRSSSYSKEETPLHVLLHKLKPTGAYFQFKKKRKKEFKPKSLVTAFQNFTISDLKEKTINSDEAEKDRKSLVNAFQTFTISDFGDNVVPKDVRKKPSTDKDAYDVKFGQSMVAV